MIYACVITTSLSLTQSITTTASGQIEELPCDSYHSVETNLPTADLTSGCQLGICEVTPETPQDSDLQPQTNLGTMITVSIIAFITAMKLEQFYTYINCLCWSVRHVCP